MPTSRSPRRPLPRLTAILASLALLLAVAARADEATDAFDYATGLMIKQEYELAADEFRALLKTNPAFPQADLAWFRLGEACYHLRQSAEAQAAYQHLLATYPASDKTATAHYRLAQLLAPSDHKAAATHYATVARQWPSNSLAEAAALWAGEEFAQAAAWSNAATAYQLAVDARPNGKYAAHALHGLGWANLKLDRLEPARQAFAALLERFPTHELAPQSRVRLGDTLHRLKRYDEARAAYQPATKADGPTAQDALIGLAWCDYDQGRKPQAATAFQTAATALGNDPRAAVCLFNAGNALVDRKDFPAARTAFQSLLERFPKHELAPEARYWIAFTQVRTGAFAEAARELEALADILKTRDAERLGALAEARTGLGDHAAAATAYAALLTAYPTHDLADEAAYGRMLALERAGKLPDAEAAGTAFLARYADRALAPLARFALGEYRFRQGKFAEAATDLAAFLKAGATPDLKDDATYKLAWCAANTKDPATAATRFAELVATQPDSPLAPESAFQLGRLAEDAGRTPDARTLYQACATKYPAAEFGQRATLALARLDVAAGKPQDALAAVDAFTKASPNSPLAPYANLYRGEALRALNRHDEALQAYRAIPPASPAASDAAEGAAWTLRQAGRHPDAATAFAALATGTTERAAENAFWHARSLEDATQFPAAADAYAALRTNHPKATRAPEAAYRRALCLSKAKRRPDAIAAYEALLKDYPATDLTPQALYDLAWVHQENATPTNAAALWTRLATEFPKSPLLPDVRFRLGEFAYDQARYAEAATNYTATLQPPVPPFADKILYKLGWAMHQLGRHPDAAAAFDRLATEFPASELTPEARYRAGRAHDTLGEIEPALAAYNAVPAGPFRERARFQAAECLRLANRLPEALAAYAAFLKDHPTSEFTPRAQLGRGHCARQAGAWADALDAYQAVVKATETVEAAQALLGIGYCHFAQGDFKEAAKAFLKVDIVYGYDELKPEALGMIAHCWTKAGDPEKAAKYAAELKTRFPNAKPVDPPKP